MKNRKKKLTNLLKTGILLFGISLFLWNCKQDDDLPINQEISTENSKPIISKSNFKELKNDALFSDLVNQLQLEDKTGLNPNLQRKKQEGELILSSNVIKKVVLGNKTSYNILAKRQGSPSNIIENVVLQNINGTYRSLLIKYTLKQTNKSSKSHFHRNSLDVELDEVEVNNYGDSLGGGGSGNPNCEYETIFIEFSCSGPGSAGNHFNPNNCQCGKTVRCTPPRSESQFVEVCESANGDISGNWQNDIDNNNGSGIGSSGIGNSSVIITPQSGISAFTYENPDGAVSLIAERLSLNQNQIDFLNNSEGELVSGILNLLGTSQGETFAQEVIKAKIENQNTEIDFEEKIINLLTDKAKCLNDKLTKKGNTFVKDILKQFQGDSKFDINIKSVDKIFRTNTTIELNGKTRHTPGSSLINIEISTNKLSDMPALAAARTLIHEYIHADMYRKINTTNYDGDLDFKTTYEKYKQGEFKATPQHNTMADLYVNPMRDALKYFHKNVLSVDYNKFVNYFGSSPSDTFYESLAWQGLKDANVEAYNNLPNPKKAALNIEADKIGLLTTDCPN